MSTLTELLAAALEAGTTTDEFNASALEAYEFDTADLAEQIATLTGNLDTANVANADSATEIAALKETISKLENEVVAVKAMNFDKLMNGAPAPDDPPVNTDGDEDENEDRELTFESLFENATEEKE